MKTRAASTFILVVLAALARAEPAKPAPFDFVPQGGHVTVIKSVACSADGRLVLSGDLDGRVKLWDALSGKELREFRGPDGGAAHDGEILETALLPGGLGASVAHDGFRIWRLDTGAELYRFAADDYPTAAGVSADGRIAVTGHTDGRIVAWDVRSGAVLRALRAEGVYVTAVAVSADGARVLTGTDGGLVSAWNLADGCLLREWNAEFGHVAAVALDSGAARAAVGGYYGAAAVFDLGTGRALRDFRGEGMVESLAFSRSAFGDFLVAGGMTTSVFDLADGGTEAVGQVGANDIALGSDPTKLYLASSFRLRRWDFSEGIGDFGGAADGVQTCSFDPVRGLAAAMNRSGAVTVWDLRAGKPRAALSPPASRKSDSPIALTPDGESCILTAPLERRSFAGEAAYAVEQPLVIKAVACSPDGRLVAVAAIDHGAIVYDAVTGAVVDTVPVEAWSKTGGNFDSADAIAFSSDGGLLAVLDVIDQRVAVRDLRAKVTRRVYALPRMTKTIAFDADGKRLLCAVGTGIGALRLADGRFAPPTGNDDVMSSCLSLSADGRLALIGMMDGRLLLRNLATGTVERTLAGHVGKILSCALSADGRFAYSAGEDGTVRAWNLATGGWTAFASDSASGEWLSYTDEGYWDGSNGCGSLVAMVRGIRAWNVDQFAARSNRPDLVLERLGSADAGLMAHFREQYLRRLKRLGLPAVESGAAPEPPEAEIFSSAKDGKYLDLNLRFGGASRLRSYNVWVNDVPVFGSYGKPIGAAGPSELVERVELGAGSNKVEAACTDADGVESLRASTTVWSSEVSEPDLYFLGFGVSKYRDARLDLSWAARDIEDLAAAFAAMKRGAGGPSPGGSPEPEDGRAFRDVHVKTLTDEAVTPAGIRAAKAFLADAKPDDILVLAISGHGLHADDAAATYYFLTHDADTANLAGTAADFGLVEDLLQGIAPRRKLFLMDTCESGADADEGASGRGPGARGPGLTLTRAAKGATIREALADRRRYIYNDLARRSGAVVLSSSRGGEASYEFDEFRNGAFTEAVLAALREGDADGDGYVDTAELRDFVAAKVALWTKGAQHPTVDRDNLSARFGFPVP